MGIYGLKCGKLPFGGVEAIANLGNSGGEIGKRGEGEGGNEEGKEWVERKSGDGGE